MAMRPHPTEKGRFTETINHHRGQGDECSRWWKENEPGKHIGAVVKRLEADQGDRLRTWLAYARLYANQSIDSLYAAGMYLGSGARNPMARVTYNLAGAVVDTAAAKIAKNNPRPLFLTTGGVWSQRKRGKLLGQFVEGVFDATGAYEEGKRAFVDGAVFGDGFVKIYADPDSAEIKIERVLPHEVWVDETEGMYGCPRAVYQRQFIHRDVLLDQYGKDDEVRAYIDAAEGANPGRGGSQTSDMIAVYEGWRLPSRPGAKDGVHSIAVMDGQLWSGPWTKDYFPFARFTYAPRVIGYYSGGMVEQIAGIQFEINKLLQTIRRSQHLMGVPRWMMPTGSDIRKEHITNEEGSFIFYNGTIEPKPFVAPSVSPELYNQLESLWQKGFEVSGVSQLSATAQKPAGLNSAVALREYSDIESERFVLVGQRYEAMFVQIAKVVVDLARDLYANKPSTRVKAPGTRMLNEIAWGDVSMSEDKYSTRVFPTSILPSTPAGRMQKVSELIEAGFIPKERGMALLDFPDLDEAVSLELAAYNDVSRIIEAITEDGTYETPEPHMDLQLAVKMGQSAYLKARTDGCPPRHLQLLRNWIQECFEMSQDPGSQLGIQMQQAQVAAAAPVTAAPATDAPMVDPMAPVDPNAPMPLMPPITEGGMPAEAMLSSPAVPSELPA